MHRNTTQWGNKLETEDKILGNAQLRTEGRNQEFKRKKEKVRETGGETRLC